MVGRILEIEKTRKKHLIKEITFVSENGHRFKAIGPILEGNAGEYYELTGSWVDDVFKFTYAKRSYSCEEEAINEILGFGLMLSKEQAKECIPLLYSTKTKEEIEEILLKIKGVGKVRAERAAAFFFEKSRNNRILRVLTEEGAKEETIIKLFSEETVKKNTIFKNPYQLIDLGEHFYVCDKIAKREKLPMLGNDRIHGFLKYLMIRRESSGNTKTDMKTLIQNAESYFLKKKEENKILPALLSIYAGSDDMLSFNEDASLSFSKTREAEMSVARELLRIRNGKANKNEKEITFSSDAEAMMKITFSEEQKKAFLLLNDGGIMLLSGGPGTGKTLTIAGIMNAYKKNFPEKKVLLCAPTGRAAARMKELSGEENGVTISTIHKALGLSHYMKGKIDELDYDLIICDEMSMADNELMSLLLPAVKTGTKLLLSGDFNQLPSVGAGRVFRDILESEAFPKTVLTKTMRQKNDSSIPENANKILSGALPVAANDFKIRYFYNDTEIEKFTDTLEYKESTMVLCPLRRGKCGSEMIARRIQKKRTLDGSSRVIGLDTFHAGDVVLMTKNNYDAGYINGDIGTIKEIDAEQCIISFSDKEVTVQNEDMTDMSLSYCMTVHKSQGSESDNVVIILPEAAGNLLLTREILYTAVTRAKKTVTIITTKNAITEAVSNETASLRDCGLKAKINSLFEKAG